jgi:hypothetical protein
MGEKIGSKFSAGGGFLHFHDSCCAQNMIKYAPHCTTLKKKKWKLMLCDIKGTTAVLSLNII